MSDELEDLKSKIDWKLIWVIAAFLVGTLFSAGMGWGRGSSSIENMTLQLAELKGAVNILSDKYTMADKAMSTELQKVEDHLAYQDERINRLEQKQAEEKK